MTNSRFVYAALLAGLLATAQAGYAQTVITGIVRDASTNAPTPDVTIQVEDTFVGATTNSDGRFEITIAALPATLVFSRIGYFSQRIRITEGAPTSREILLVPAVYDLEPIIVTEPLSAAEIMQRVIERKQAWRTRLKGLLAEAYTRFTVENETEIVFILEGLADVSWNKDQGWKAVVKSYRRTSTLFTDDDLDDFETLDDLAAGALVLNLYDDDIDIADHNLMGVTHPNALKSYDFELQGQRLLDDTIVYDIGVKPKNKLFSGFVGRVSVLDGEYAMIEADLRPGQSFIFPPPIRSFNISVKQQFARYGGAYWLPVGAQADTKMDVGIVGFVFPTFKARLVAQLTDYKVYGAQTAAEADTLPPPTVTVPVTRDIRANLNDSLLTIEGRMVPLSERERDAYETIDTTMTFLKAFEPRGFIAEFMKKRGVFDEERADRDSGAEEPSLSGRRRNRNRNNSGPSAIGVDYTSDFRYNRVDAAHLGLETTVSIRNTPLAFTGAGAYNTGAGRWDYGGGVTLRLNNRHRRTVSLNYMKHSDTRYRSEVYSPRLTSVLPLFGEDDYFDYFLNERLHLNMSSRFGERRRLTLSGGIHRERHRSLAKTTDYALFGIDHTQRPNPSITEGDLVSVSVRGELGQRPQPFSPEGGRYFSLNMEFTHPDLLDSDFKFSRYDLMLAWRMKTLFQRRMFPNTLDLRVVGGASTGTLPPQRFGILDGSLAAAGPFGVFKTRRAQPYEGERYAGFFWEHNFRTVPFELLGLMPIARRGIGLSVYGGHGRAWIADARLATLGYNPHYQDRFHHEAGVSLNGLFYFFRLDFTKRLDASGFFIGLGIGPAFVE